MAELNTENIKPQNVEIEYKNGMIYAYHHTYECDTLLWSAPDDTTPVIYNQPVPAPINLSYRVQHYHDMDTGELYKSYAKILALIKYVGDQVNSHKRNSSTDWTITDLRDYCQTWLDDVRFRQDGKERLWWVDRLRYFFRGRLKQRQMWLNTFGTICFDMCTKLDAIDGGHEEQPVSQITVPSHKIGF